MRRSILFANYEGSAPVYAHLSKAAAWEPPRSANAQDVLWKLAESCFPRSAGSGQDNKTIPSAYTFLGQFVTHDVTFDSRLDRRYAHLPHRSLRTPALDLDSVYGRGPIEEPHLYELADRDKFVTPRTESGEFDLPRNNDASVLHPSSGRSFNLRRTAVIGDPRNDENILVAQLHLAFLRFHNAAVDRLRQTKLPGDRIFDEARKETTWHYQWAVVQFLRRLCGDQIIDNAIAGNPLRIERLGPPPVLPFEFTLAAFRFGHSMIGPSYHLNDVLQKKIGAPIQMFQETGAEWESRDMDAANSLEGERVLPPDWSLQWDRFLDIGRGATQWSQRINPQLAAPLRHLPLPGSRRDQSLAYLTLWRGYEGELPSGQSLARELDLSVPALDSANDPLWFYILREAESERDGESLGPLGATLVGEVLIGLLRRDPRSYLVAEPGWQPSLPIHPSKLGSKPRSPKPVFDLADFLWHAGVPIGAKDWKTDRNRR